MPRALLVRALLACLLFVACTAARGGPNIALYYGKDPPWEELAAFDAVVVEPDNVPEPGGAAGPRTEVFAYLSVGEVHPQRSYFADLPASWKAGANPAWGSIVVDQSRSEWPHWFVDKAVRPLWNAGYRGFFLDTLDSYQLHAKTDAARAAQEAGLARVITEIRRAFPGAKLIFNRGFEILPRVHSEAYAVAAESLFRGWDQAHKSYREVPEADRAWLLAQLLRVRDEYRLPVLAIDYVAPEDRDLARATAKRIAALGFTPWVTNPELDLLGIGKIEVMPRRILMVYEQEAPQLGLAVEEVHLFGAMPLNYLGYTVEYADVSQPLPRHRLAGRYAGIVTWFQSDDVARETELPQLLARARAEGVKIAFIGTFGLRHAELVIQTLGLDTHEPSGPTQRISIEHRDPLVGFEMQPLADRRGFYPLRAAGGQALLRLENERGEIMEPVALMPWGGYALAPYGLFVLPRKRGARWVTQPIEFLRRALALTQMPVPDTTTENGRRLMLAHVDGDGFPSRAEFPGSPFAGEVMLKQVLERFRIPTTVSIIEGEVAAAGLHGKESPALETIARRIFALPHVEIASHSLSHPFRWRSVEHASESGLYNLTLPNYKFDLAREIGGSIEYIDRRLAPAGKTTRVFLWTGDCNPGDDALAHTEKAGVLNMNGGNTWITRAEPSLTLVAPLGLPRGRNFQVYAPNQNENVYTNLWTGPFNGYERAIETFQLTDAPWRIKPIDIYYHSYAASKRASLGALEKVYRWALSQPVLNVYASEYVRKVLDYNRITVARNVQNNEWTVRGSGALRTLRLPSSAGYPDLEASRGVAGFARHNDQIYLHLASGEAQIVLSPQPPRVPYLAEANARLERLAREQGLSLEFSGHVPLAFALGNAAGCEVRAAGQAISPKPDAGGLARFELTQHGTTTITVRCRN